MQMKGKLDMQSVDFLVLLRQKRFAGLRIGVLGVSLALISCAIGMFGYMDFGIPLFVIAWIIVVIGFLVHVTRNGPQRK